MDTGFVAELYNFPKEGSGWASQMDKFAQGKFSTPVNPKDEYVVVDCEDLREWRVLEFVVLILYLEKPTWIIVTISNTISGALSGARLVSWGNSYEGYSREVSFQAGEGKTFSHQPLSLSPLQ